MAAIMVAAALAAAANAPLAPVGKWNVEYADSACGLSHDYGDAAAPVTLGFRPLPLGTNMEMVLIEHGSGGTPAQRDAGTLTIDDGPAIDLHFTTFGLPDKRLRVTTLYIGEGHVDRLPTAKTINLSLGNRRYAFAPPPSIKAAFAALDTCSNDLLKRWGVDPHESDAVTVPAQPATDRARWITQNDYPTDALRARQQGTTVMLWEIATDGRAGNCRVIGSSGSASLDTASCHALERRGSYHPALGRDGKPIATHASQRVVWRMPG